MVSREAKIFRRGLWSILHGQSERQQHRWAVAVAADDGLDDPTESFKPGEAPAMRGEDITLDELKQVVVWTASFVPAYRQQRRIPRTNLHNPPLAKRLSYQV